MTSAVRESTRRFTVDEVLRMVDAGILQDGEPLELLDGELVMVPRQGPEHSTGTTRLRDLLIRAYGEGHVVREDKALVAGATSLPEPDVAVVRGHYDDFARRHPRADEAILVVELAKTTIATDRRKAAIYARAGAAVYWLVDMNEGRLEVHTVPQADGRYAVVHVLAAEDRAALPGVAGSIGVSELLVAK